MIEIAIFSKAQSFDHSLVPFFSLHFSQIILQFRVCLKLSTMRDSHTPTETCYKIAFKAEAEASNISIGLRDKMIIT